MSRFKAEQVHNDDKIQSEGKEGVENYFGDLVKLSYKEINFVIILLSFCNVKSYKNLLEYFIIDS